MAALRRAIRWLGRALAALWRARWRIVGLAAAALVVAVLWAYERYSRDEAEAFFDDPVEHFKYGSTGGDRLAGIPVPATLNAPWGWKARPMLSRPLPN